MRERPRYRLGARDWQFSFLAMGAFVVFAILSAAFIGSYRSAAPLVIVTIVAAYAIAATVEFEVGVGSAVPTELVLVPMLFLVPLGLVPACVAAGLLLADIPRYWRREAHPERAVQLVMSAWYAADPVIVLAAFGATEPKLSHWPVYVLALAAQFAIDFLVSTSRPWYAFGTPRCSRSSARCCPRGRRTRPWRRSELLVAAD